MAPVYPSPEVSRNWSEQTGTLETPHCVRSSAITSAECHPDLLSVNWNPSTTYHSFWTWRKTAIACGPTHNHIMTAELLATRKLGAWLHCQQCWLSPSNKISRNKRSSSLDSEEQKGNGSHNQLPKWVSCGWKMQKWICLLHCETGAPSFNMKINEYHLHRRVLTYSICIYLEQCFGWVFRGFPISNCHFILRQGNYWSTCCNKCYHPRQYTSRYG